MNNLDCTTTMIGRLVAILWISYLKQCDSLSPKDYENCLQLRFVGKGHMVSDYSEDMGSTFVRISVANVLQNFADRMAKEWKHSCVLAQIEDQSSISKASDKILWFMQTLKSNKKALILNQEILGRMENTLHSIHRSYGIFVKDVAGTLEHFPVLGIRGSKDDILQVGYLFIWPYVIRNEQGQLTGTDIKALDLLARKYGFRYKLVMFNRLLHSSLPNGTSIGVFPDINNGVFDMGVGQLTITKDRRILVEFSINMFYREVGFGGSLAQRVDAFNTLILPFDTSIWLALLVSVATYFALLVVSEFVMGYKQKQSDQIFTSFCLTVSPLLNDSVPSRMHSKNRYTARWFSLTLWLLLGVMLSMAYKSNLLATLTIVKKENPINSPEEILNTGYPVYSLAGTVLSEGLQSSPMAIYRQIYQESVLDKKSLLIFGASWDSANEEIRNGKAFKATTKFDALADPTIRFLPDPFFIGSSGWFFMKGSVIEKQISAECGRLIEAGLLYHWERDYIEKKKQDNTAFYETLAPIHAVQPISVIHFLPIVLSCSIGYALSLLSFFFELLFGKNHSWVAPLKKSIFERELLINKM